MLRMADKDDWVIRLTHVGDPSSPQHGKWYALVPRLGGGEMTCGPGDLKTVVASARMAEDGVHFLRNIKVAEGTRLSSQDVIALIDANGPWPRRIDLSGCQMQGVDLSRELILKSAELYRGDGADGPAWQSETTGGIFLWNARLRDADLSEANLAWADLRGARLENAYFHKCNLTGANLLQARMEHAHLGEAILNGAHLQQARMAGAFLRRTELRNANLRWADLQSVDMRMYAELRNVRWYGAHLDRTKLSRTQLGNGIGDERAAKGNGLQFPGVENTDFREAAEAYQTLKNNFQSIGRYDDAVWAYIKEKQMERASHFPTGAGHRWLRYSVRRLIRNTRHTRPSSYDRLDFRLLYQLYSALLLGRLFVGWCPPPLRTTMQGSTDGVGSQGDWVSRKRWLRNWAYELTTGYGERPANVVGLGTVIVLCFATAYFLTGAIESVSDSLSYSFATFATFNLTDPGVQPHGRWMNFASSVEALLGIAILALFVFTLGNRMSRS